MPKYTYTCPVCSNSAQKIVNISDNRSFDCSCGNQMVRQMPKLSSTKTTEVIDKYTNQKHVTDQKQIIHERKLDYYWDKLVPEMVNSGTYTLETMLEKGWVYYDEKNNLVTRTKAPQKS